MSINKVRRYLNLRRVLNYPSYTYKTMSLLPKQPGLYYVVRDKRVLYIGLAGVKRSTIKDRWLSYDYNPHSQINYIRAGAVIHCRVVSNHNRRYLPYMEAVEIQRFNPLNNIQTQQIKVNVIFSQL